MKLPHEPPQGNSGYYGGVGTRRAHQAWTPVGAKPRAARERVPARFRKLRIRKTRRSVMEPTPDYVVVPVFTVSLGFLILVVLLIFG